MSTIAVLLMSTRTEATLVIISLLLVSAIIGYVTAWLYFRFIHKGEVETLESIIRKREIQIDKLENKNNSLENDLEQKNKELELQRAEIKNLKGLYTKAENETSRITLKNAKNEQKISEQEEALLQIAKRKHLIDYSSFGRATIEEKDDLQMISGIGPFIEERLHAIDIYSYKQISKFTAKDIEKINIAIEYFAGRIERDEWVAQAKELVQDEIKEAALNRIRARDTKIYFERIGIAQKHEADNLTIINGIGGWIEEKLNALGIFTFRQIASFNEEDVEIVTEAIEFFPERIERDEWVSQAKELLKSEGKRDVILDKVKEKKSILSYNRIGIAPKYYSNNLTLILGISPWIEEKLNKLEIFTFAQISRLTTEDVNTITEILEIAPKRIERDNWIGQAKELDKTKITFPLQ
jgi:predicted flap endonuclease-1-like 5' DNA nuclease